MTTAPAASERRWDRGAWLTLAVTLAWLVATVGMALWALSYPSDGWTYRRDNVDGVELLNDRYHAGPTPLQTDDVVLALNGQPLGFSGQAPLPPGTPAGTLVIYTVARVTLTAAGPVTQTLEVPVTLAAPGPAGFGIAVWLRVVHNWRDLVVATAGLALGLAAFLARPGHLGARYLLLVFAYYGSVQWFGFVVSDPYGHLLPPTLQLLYALEGGGWVWYFFPSIGLMGLSIPVVKRPLRRWPRLLPALAYGLPLGLGLVIGDPATRPALAEALTVPVFVGTIALAMAALAVSLVHNWLTIRAPAERAQLRWVGLGLVVGMLAPFVWLALGVGLAGAFPTNDLLVWLPLALPLCLAIAITRYRLWDIDVIIRRTLIYSVLTAVLGLAYLGSVLVLQPLLARLTGQGSALATVLSTLVVAALFVPVRNRVQRAIDRRFYRRKYDAARTLAGFGAQARDEVDLDRLSGHLIDVVEDTMQPASLGLWLKAAPGRRAREPKQP
jgi:hypothetical protein